jgi:hypothetical protein
MEARSRKHGNQRVVHYGCSAFQRKGSKVCSNNLTVAMDTAGAEVLEALRTQLLAPSIVEEAMRGAESELTAPRSDELSGVKQRIAALEAEAAKLAEALAKGGQMSVLIDALKDRENEKQRLQQRSAAFHTTPGLDFDVIGGPPATGRSRMAPHTGEAPSADAPHGAEAGGGPPGDAASRGRRRRLLRVLRSGNAPAIRQRHRST